MCHLDTSETKSVSLYDNARHARNTDTYYGKLWILLYEQLKTAKTLLFSSKSETAILLSRICCYKIVRDLICIQDSFICLEFLKI